MPSKSCSTVADSVASSESKSNINMDTPFTRQENLFILVEMIKASDVEIESLVTFINSNNISPDWMNMQLPLGRNMNQCMEAAREISVAPPHASLTQPLGRDTRGQEQRQSSNAENALNKSMNSTGKTKAQQQLSPPSSSRPHQPYLLPKPSTLPPVPPLAPLRSPTEPLTSLQAPTTKKRGRPSRADKGKWNLRPLLPHHQTVPLGAETKAHRPILPAFPPPYAQVQAQYLGHCQAQEVASSSATPSTRSAKLVWPRAKRRRLVDVMTAETTASVVAASSKTTSSIALRASTASTTSNQSIKDTVPARLTTDDPLTGERNQCGRAVADKEVQRVLCEIPRTPEMLVEWRLRQNSNHQASCGNTPLQQPLPLTLPSVSLLQVGPASTPALAVSPIPVPDPVPASILVSGPTAAPAEASTVKPTESHTTAPRVRKRVARLQTPNSSKSMPRLPSPTNSA